MATGEGRTEQEKETDRRYYREVTLPKRKAARKARLAAGAPRRRKAKAGEPTEALMMRVPASLKAELVAEAERRSKRSGNRVTITDVALPRLDSRPVPDELVERCLARATAEGRNPETFVTELLREYASG